MLTVKVASPPPLGVLVALDDTEPARLPRGLAASAAARLPRVGEMEATEDMRLALALLPSSSALRLRLGLRLLRLLLLLLLLPALAAARARIFAA